MKNVMKITDEFGLVNKITRGFKNYHNLVAGVGDDTAVIKNGNKYLLLTCDALAEGDHFDCSWSTPEQIGNKAVEVNVSDVASTGGRPTLMLISIAITKDTPEEWVVGVYRGIKQVCNKYKITLAGGDTIHSGVRLISIALLGESEKPILRSGARVGDLIGVTGVVGGAAAGLRLLKQGAKISSLLKQKHLSPRARLDISDKIARYAHSMIDISDGVASEIKHICEESRKGAMVYAEQIPLCPGANLAEALSGGEDYELLFTLAPGDTQKLKNSGVGFTIIGEVTEKKNGIVLKKEGRNQTMPDGYNHFI
jgi:thiamine-monophosphate kinase